MEEEYNDYNEEQPMGDMAQEEYYDEVATEAPPRDIDIPEDTKTAGTKSLSDRFGDVSDLSDMQTYLMRLFPPNLTNSTADIDNLIMVSRISPEVFLPMLHLMVEEEVMTSDPDKPISVNNIIMKCYSLLSIGDLGKGRIDIAELAGAAREEKKIENALRGM